MTKIRIPRKLKKYADRILSKSWKQFPNVPKLMRYHSWFIVEKAIKKYGVSAEELYTKFGSFAMDDIIWWNWVRWKELGIKPKMTPKFQKYWDFFVEKGVINIKEEKL